MHPIVRLASAVVGYCKFKYYLCLESFVRCRCNKNKLGLENNVPRSSSGFRAFMVLLNEHSVYNMLVMHFLLKRLQQGRNFKINYREKCTGSLTHGIINPRH